MSESPLTQDQLMRAHSAQKFMKAHGIVTIVVGGVMVLGALLAMILLGWLSLSSRSQSDAIAAFVAGVVFFVLVMIPGIYLTWSGIALMRLPTVPVAKNITIINLVVSIIYQNYVLIVLAIIGLTQLNDYKHKDQTILK